MGTQIAIKRLTGAIGAEVKGVNLNQPLDEPTFAILHQAHLEHCILVFRGQFLDPVAQTVFTQCWGEILHDPFFQKFELPDHPGVQALRNPGKAHASTEQWHSDISFAPTPSAHTILAAQVLPEAGGDTMFANQYLAYATLSDGLQRLLRELRAVHGVAKLNTYSYGGLKVTAGQQSHPVVRIHPETGRQALYVNQLYTLGFEGMTEEESRGLLQFLLEQSHRAEFTYRHQWQPGDVIMWDNRCTVHSAVHDYGDAPRVMHRTSVAGDMPR